MQEQRRCSCQGRIRQRGLNHVDALVLDPALQGGLEEVPGVGEPATDDGVANAGFERQMDDSVSECLTDLLPGP